MTLTDGSWGRLGPDGSATRTRPKTYVHIITHNTLFGDAHNTSGNTRGTEAAATRGRRANHTLRTRTVSSDVIEGSGPTAQSRESPILVVACTCSPGKVGAMVGAIEGASLAWSAASGRLRPLTSQWRLCLLPASPPRTFAFAPPKRGGGGLGGARCSARCSELQQRLEERRRPFGGLKEALEHPNLAPELHSDLHQTTLSRGGGGGRALGRCARGGARRVRSQEWWREVRGQSPGRHLTRESDGSVSYRLRGLGAYEARLERLG